MKIVLQFLLTISIIGIVAANSLSQTTAEKLSANEEREIREFAGRFSTQLQITRDLTPFLNQPLASRTIDKLLADPNNSVELVKRNVARKVGRTELRQFYIAMLNLTYLSYLYLYSTYSLEKTILRDLPPEKRYPSNAVRIMKSNPLVAKWWKPDSQKEMEKVINGVEKMKHLKHTWQQASVSMRHYFRRYPPEQTSVFKENKLIVERDLGEISVTTCDSKENCDIFPLHTQTITVNLPVLQVLLVRINGTLKFLATGFNDD